jgi:hypothetical protein
MTFWASAGTSSNNELNGSASLHPTFPPLGMFSGEPAVTVFAITWQKSRQRQQAVEMWGKPLS